MNIRFFIFCLSTSLLFTLKVIAQKNDITYLDEDFREVEKSEASYYRLSQPHPDGTDKLFVQTYYSSGKIQSNATCYTSLCIRKEGYYISYYENGNKKEEGHRVKGSKSGKWNRWYENGQLKESSSYIRGGKVGIWKTWYQNGQIQSENESFEGNYSPSYLSSKLISYWDSTGTQLVSNGNGEVVYYYDKSNHPSSKGAYQDGFKNGTWEGYTKEGQLSYRETYRKNNVSGLSWDEEGNQYRYKELEVRAEPKIGYKRFSIYLDNALKYPESAHKKGIEGRVYVQFEVDEEGNIINIELLKGIGKDCDAESVRIIKNSPKWNPGQMRGQPIVEKVILPITFKLT
ncbi:energy transducer TonB [Reichenbachiella ulvae]|uniref:TonB family protein n=1 Tax=Reichenbachiella ulvae TaxID=2980104 RepID=A0ABT3CTG3_9BACT|nr:energy transducer TonB [Reichenbachiella ulvae]MCV9386843.1 TonB family protein [Reichenbachiella ulvae]